mmetsp:Transcript_118165/g.294749  ORF Transcript_118165/g.294749 Transcript_118165/m.294749 type:complete len:212 (-) Transcript_118165:1503-2138(-)
MLRADALSGPDCLSATSPPQMLRDGFEFLNNSARLLPQGGLGNDPSRTALWPLFSRSGVANSSLFAATPIAGATGAVTNAGASIDVPMATCNAATASANAAVAESGPPRGIESSALPAARVLRWCWPAMAVAAAAMAAAAWASALVASSLTVPVAARESAGEDDEEADISRGALNSARSSDAHGLVVAVAPSGDDPCCSVLARDEQLSPCC